MNHSPDQCTNLGWLQVLPLIVIVAMAIVLWKPADDRLRSFGPFPPDAQASRALADALIRCGTTAIPAALIGIEQAVSGAGLSCGPGRIDEIVRNARAVASTDPNPRRNWW